MAVGGVLVRQLGIDAGVTQTGPDTAGKVLTSNGAGALPTFQTPVTPTITDYVVASNGATPPAPADDGAANFIYVAYTP